MQDEGGGIRGVECGWMAAPERRGRPWFVRFACLVALVLPGLDFLGAAPPSGLRFPKHKDLFFVEDNLVYSRCLNLSHDGTYRQINRDPVGATEVDQGTWEQTADGTVALHSTYRGLRFRALQSGPLTVQLDSIAEVDALPEVGAAVRRLLDEARSDVFSTADVEGLNTPPAAVMVARGAESFLRQDLSGLAGQIAQTVQTERSRTYRLTPQLAPGGPLLLVLQGATYLPGQVAETCRAYRVPRGSPPPFYFARVAAAAFARRVGRWRELAPPGGPSGP